MPSPFAAPLATLAAVALAGRVVLSLLPPGPIGGHDPRALPATWAASHLLGLVALGLLQRTPLAGAAGIGIVAAIGLARLALSPGALVPGPAGFDLRSHEPRYGVPVLLALLLVAAAGSALASVELVALHPFAGDSAAEHGDPWLAAATWLAAMVLVDDGFAAARVRFAWRALAVVALGAASLALAAGGEPAISAAAAGLLAGAAVAVRWLRRADRRALALATVGCAASLADERWRFVGAGLLAGLVLASARAARPTALRFAAAALLAVGAPALLFALAGER